MILITDDSLEKIDKQLGMICASIPTYKTTYGKVSLEELDLTVKDREISSHHHHHHGIKSMTYTFTGPIDRQLFLSIYNEITKYVLRLKVMCHLEINQMQFMNFNMHMVYQTME